MLEFFFDDSGTHDGSRIAVWGGVVGHKEFVQELESAWKYRLRCPCDGKPPIRAFHSSHLAASFGEFENYNEAERDLTRRNFRQIILDAGLTILAFGVSVSDWEEIVTGQARETLGSAERSIFGQAILAGCKAAISEQQPLSIQFDIGRRRPELESMIQLSIEEAEAKEYQVRYGFSSVASNMGLQAADLVAHETYKYFSQFIDDPNVSPDPHLHRLIKGAHDVRMAWVGRQQIEEMMQEVSPHIRRLHD